MKCRNRFRLSGLSIVMTAVLTGCIDMTHDLRIAHDGSTVYRLQYAITESAISQFKVLDKLAADIMQAEGRRDGGVVLHPLLRAMLEPRDEVIAAALTPYRNQGLIVDELRVSSREARRRLDLRVSTRDLKPLETTDFFRLYGFALQREESGRVIFERHPHIDETRWAGIEMDEESRRQLEPLLNGFRCVVQVTVPGRIVNSTARRTTLHTAAWEFDFSTMPDVLLRLQKQAFRVVFESPDAVLPSIGYEGGGNRRNAGTP